MGIEVGGCAMWYVDGQPHMGTVEEINDHYVLMSEDGVDGYSEVEPDDLEEISCDDF